MMIPLAARRLPLVGARVEGVGPAIVVAVVAGRQRSGGVVVVVPGARISSRAREANTLSVAVVGVAIVASGGVVVAIRFQDGHLGGEGRQTLGRRLAAVQRPLLAIGPEPAVGASIPAGAIAFAAAGSLVAVFVAPVRSDRLRWPNATSTSRPISRRRCHRYRRPAGDAHAGCGVGKFGSAARGHGEEGRGDVRHAATAANTNSAASIRADAAAGRQSRPAHRRRGGGVE